MAENQRPEEIPLRESKTKHKCREKKKKDSRPNIFTRYITIYVNLIVPRPRNAKRKNHSCRLHHLAMILIILIKIALYIVDRVQVTKPTDPFDYGSGSVSRTLIWDPNLPVQTWRFLTYMFVHEGLQHLLVNLLAQLFIGIPLEMVHGWWRGHSIYFLGVLAGSLGHSVLDRSTKLAGAGGGVYSILTAHIAAVIMNWSRMTLPWIQLLIILVVMVLDTGALIYQRYFTNDPVEYVSHFAGAAAGLLMGMVVLKNVSLTCKKKVVWCSALGILVGLMAAAVFYNMYYYYFYIYSILSVGHGIVNYIPR